MDFAKKLLMKYGWKEGEGIGKNSDGILKPIKANLKFDNAGLAYERGKEFTDHWWERAFNNASQNLNVNNSSESVSVAVKDNESIQITTSGLTKKQLMDKNYNGTFLKSKRKHDKDLNNCDSDTSEQEDIPQNTFQISNISDAELIKACGGRTAHKGARHGLSLIGKLSRIEAQEQQMLEKINLNRDTAPDMFKDWIEVKKKRKNKKEKKQESQATQNCDAPLFPNSKSDDCDGLVNLSEYQIKSKKKKKQHRRRDEDLAKRLGSLKTSDISEISQSSKNHGIKDSSKAIKREKLESLKLSKRRTNETEDIAEQPEINTFLHQSKKKKSKGKKNKCRDISPDNLSCDSIDQQANECKDQLVESIESIMEKHPNKKFKIVSHELTSLQNNHLRKSGLRVEMKSKKRDKKNELKVRNQVNKINKNIQRIMTLSD